MKTFRHSGAASRLGDAAAENPGRTALLSLITTPLAMRAGRVALRWAQRNPGMALVLAAGAVAWWARSGNGNDRSIGGDESAASSL